MGQMTVTFEWPNNLGPRWFNKEALEVSLFNSPVQDYFSLKIKSVVFPDSTAKEQAQDEFQQLSVRMDILGALSYKAFMALEEETRYLLSEQYEAMTIYRKAILARIEAWIDETS